MSAILVGRPLMRSRASCCWNRSPVRCSAAQATYEREVTRGNESVPHCRLRANARMPLVSNAVARARGNGYVSRRRAALWAARLTAVA